MKIAGRVAAVVLASAGIFLPASFAQTSSHTTVPNVDAARDAAARAAVAKAQAAMDHKDFGGAAKICEDYLDINPDSAAVHFELGYANTALGKLEDAASEYREAIDLDPKMGPAYLNLGLTLIDQDPDEALSTLEQANDLMPGQSAPKYALGVALEHAGKHDAAIEQFREALKLDAHNFPAQLDLARALLHANKIAEAEPEFRKAISLQPNSAAAHLGMAECFVQEKKSSDAASELNTYLQSQPKDSAARIELASILTELGKNDEALAELDRAAAILPEDAPTLKLRSLVEFRLENYDAALVALQKLEAMTPGDLDVRARIGHLRLKKKDYPGAAKELASVFQADPSQTEVLRDLLAANYLGGNYTGALELMELLSKRETLSDGSWYVRGNCYDKLGKVREALDAYRKFLELNAGKPNDEYFFASERVRILQREPMKKE